MSKKQLHETDSGNFEFKERVCAHFADGRHMIIVQALCKDTRDIVWASGDDQFCAVTREDFVRNKIPYNSVLIQEFPYKDYSPESVGIWRPLIESLMVSMLKKYMEHDGFVHVYPQWLPEAAYSHWGKELFDQMAGGCDHIILYCEPHIMEFVPRRPAERESVMDKIREAKEAAKAQPGPERKPKTNQKSQKPER